MKLEFIVALLILPISLCRIVEKVETACNGPCGQLRPSCPSGQRVAIRDAVYRVQDKVQSCTPFPGCSDKSQSLCCDPTPQDCVFPYSPMHLRAVLRNCSGSQDCVIQTERSEVETVACSSSEPQNTSSQTALNYVCVDDDKITDICSSHDSVVEGKTLFAMVDPKGKEKITKGSVCTCMAESTRWPTTNSIAVFLVDLRMNKRKGRPCSGATLSMRSGNNVKKLDCASSDNPRVNFPFVAVLNDSNVATLRLELANHLPEFVWIGFEANEEENIRLTCKLQGVSPGHSVTEVPTTTESGIDDNIDDGGDNKDGGAVITGDNNRSGNNGRYETNNEGVDGTKEETKKANRGGSKARSGIVIGVVLAVLVVIVVLLVIAFFVVRKRKRYPRSSNLDEIDLDVYHSIDSTLDRSSFKGRVDTDFPKDAPAVGKRKKSNKRVRIVSTPDLMEDVLPEYTSAVEVREKKRTSQRPDLTQTKSNNYDHLRDDTNNPKQSDLILDSYDQLDCPPPYSSIDGLQGDMLEPRGNQSKMSSARQLQGNANEAYEDTEGCVNFQHRQSMLMEECGALYFELENDNNPYKDSVVYEGPPCIPSAPDPETTKVTPTLTATTPPKNWKPDVPPVSASSPSPPSSSSVSPPQSPLYNEAISLPDTTSSLQSTTANSDEQTSSTSGSDSDKSDSSTDSDSDKTEDPQNSYQNHESLKESIASSNENDASKPTKESSNETLQASATNATKSTDEPDRRSLPIAAPRKMSLVETKSSLSEYDIAQPIEEL